LSVLKNKLTHRQNRVEFCKTLMCDDMKFLLGDRCASLCCSWQLD
jgi:hypothetical protein